jgi:hypothetical protein
MGIQKHNPQPLSSSLRPASATLGGIAADNISSTMATSGGGGATPAAQGYARTPLSAAPGWLLIFNMDISEE